MKQSEISDQNNELIVSYLNLLLAEEYVLYTKTRTAHWNIDGSNYFELHVFLENQYNTLNDMIDNIAEQIRSLGHYAISSLKDLLRLAKANDVNQNYSNSNLIFEALLHDHETMIGIIQHEVYPILRQSGDPDTSDFVIGLSGQHENIIQMIRSFLSEPDFHKPGLIKNYNVLFSGRNN